MKPSKEQLTPKSQKHGKIDTKNLPADLVEIVRLWPEMPEHIKAAISCTNDPVGTFALFE